MPAREPAGVPPWRPALTTALRRGRSARESRYLQLATVDDSGCPRNRTVVFRGFGPDSELLILTDLRSAKCAELGREPRTELCWYLPITREQFRLSALATLHGADCSPPWTALRRRLWEERGRDGQAEWLDAIPDQALAEPIAPFVVIACTVFAADHLDLGGAVHRGIRFERDGDGWRTAPVKQR